MNELSSIYIVLKQYKDGHISEEETVQLIEDLYKTRETHIPVTPWYPQITWREPQKWEITCDNDSAMKNKTSEND